MSSRIFIKFLGIQLVICLLVIAAGLSYLAHRRVVKAEEEFSVRIGVFTARVSTLVGKVNLNQEADVASRYLGLLLSDRGILCVDLLDNGVAIADLAAPRRIGCRGTKPSSFMQLPVPSQAGKTLRIGISADELTAVRQDFREFSIILALGALLIAGGASWLAFRRVIGRPLSVLLAGIRAATGNQQPTHVEKLAQDEIGEVVDAFNEMRDHLDVESLRVRSAKERIDHLYNATPALLFTMNERGECISSSRHWLEITGFARSEVIGQNLGLTLTEGANRDLQETYLPALRKGKSVRNEPLTLRCKNGDERHVLFSAIPEMQADEASPAFICILSDVTELKSAEAQLQKLAWTDSLTGLSNRARLIERLGRVMSLPAETRGLAAVMLIDLDNFKWVNDNYGHAAGDTLLVEAARRISICVRQRDLVARLGGDEFAVLLDNLTDEAQALELAHAIIAAFVEGIPLENAVGRVSASIGVAFAGIDQVLSGAELMRRADQAMYASKRAGKSRYEVYDTRHGDEDRLKSERMERIEAALASDNFRLAFQPIVDLRTTRPVGVEALLRLDTPDGRLDSIQDLIEVAEETGQMERLGNWILHEAVSHYTALATASGNPDFYLSVNLSARQVTEGFATTLIDLLARRKDLRGKLLLEITETVAVRRFDMVSRILESVREHGARIAIDDFGTGYSSLSYITSLPVDIIKLDRSFVNSFAIEIGHEAGHFKRKALARITAAIGRELNLKITAEGIETPQQALQMRELGIEYGQGYGFSPPLPAKECLEWLALFGGPDRQPVPKTGYPPAIVALSA